jgi:hypothetical protein
MPVSFCWFVYFRLCTLFHVYQCELLAPDAVFLYKLHSDAAFATLSISHSNNIMFYRTHAVGTIQGLLKNTPLQTSKYSRRTYQVLPHTANITYCG